MFLSSLALPHAYTGSEESVQPIKCVDVIDAHHSKTIATFQSHGCRRSVQTNEVDRSGDHLALAQAKQMRVEIHHRLSLQKPRAMLTPYEIYSRQCRRFLY